MPLTSDIVFKRVFAKEENKDLLKDILEAILKVKIESIEIKNPEIPQNLTDSKAGTLDIKVEINENTVIDVEMQVENEYNIDDRSTRYLISMSEDELKKGEDYSTIRKVITINLLNFNYFKRNSFFNIAHMKFEKNTKDTYINMGYSEEDEIATEKLEMVYIELPKFKKKSSSQNNALNQWLWLIIGEEEKIKMASKENIKIKKAVDIIEEMSADPKEWERYRSRQMAIMNYNAGINNAQERGRQEGKQEGKKEGRKEEKLRIAKKMKSKSMSIKEIEELTGVTKEEIVKL